MIVKYKRNYQDMVPSDINITSLLIVYLINPLVKKTTYGSIPKNNELTKLTAEIKETIQKIEEEKNRKTKKKTVNDYANLIQSIKKEYQKLV